MLSKDDITNIFYNSCRLSDKATCEIFGDVSCSKALKHISTLQFMDIEVNYAPILPGSFALNKSPVYYFEDPNKVCTRMTKLGQISKTWKERWFTFDSETKKIFYYKNRPRTIHEENKKNRSQPMGSFRGVLKRISSESNLGEISLTECQKVYVRFSQKSVYLSSSNKRYCKIYLISTLGWTH